MRVLQDKDYRLFEKLVSLNEKQMVQAMTQLIKSKYDNVIATKDYIIAIGDIPIALVAHMDTAPDVSHIWAKQAAPFKNIIFKDVDVQAYVECVNAEVEIEGGLFKKKELSSKELQERINNIENNKNLLH